MKWIEKSKERWQLFQSFFKRLLRQPSGLKCSICRIAFVLWNKMFRNTCLSIRTGRLCLEKKSRWINTSNMARHVRRRVKDGMLHNAYFLAFIASFVQTKTMRAMYDYGRLGILRNKTVGNCTTKDVFEAAGASLVQEPQTRTSSKILNKESKPLWQVKPRPSSPWKLQTRKKSNKSSR